MNYRGYLKTDAWKSFRNGLIAERGCCEYCGTTDYLEIHHLAYDRLCNEAPEDVMVLCSDCHREIGGMLEEDLNYPEGPNDPFH